VAYYILPTSNGGSRHGDHGEVVGDLLLGGAGEQLSHHPIVTFPEHGVNPFHAAAQGLVRHRAVVQH
jgi:hypothetical protein